MQRILVVAALVAAAASGPTGRTVSAQAPASATIATLRLLHWNAHHGGRRTDGVYDPTGFVSWIVRFNPHVVTLNEIDSTAQANTIVTQLRTQMPGVEWTGHYVDRFGNMIVSRLPVVAKSICLVNATTNRRIAHVRLVVNGGPINVWSAHLALDSGKVRLAETRGIQACEASHPEARVVAGDFNMQPDTPEYMSMTEGHVDAWRAAAAMGAAVNYAGNCDGCTRNTRIDFVFTSKRAETLTLRSAQIFDTRNSAGVMPSDHKPLLVVYDVAPGAQRAGAR